jgi:hypothetical protein
MLVLSLGEVNVRVRHVRRGAFVVEHAGASSEAPSVHDVARIARSAFRIVDGESHAIVIAAECEGATGTISRGRGVTGFRLALHVGAMSYATGVGRFDDAVARLLGDAPPWPENVPRDGAPLVLDARFSAAAFAADPHPAIRAGELAGILTAYLDASGSAAQSWLPVIEALRALGHDLWSWDDFGDGAIWSYDYRKQREGAGLRLTVSYPSLAAPTVEAEYEPP